MYFKCQQLTKQKSGYFPQCTTKHHLNNNTGSILTEQALRDKYLHDRHLVKYP